jgi:beta-lactamase class A
VENLVNRALMYSNNVAVNMLGRHLGWQNIRDWTKTIGGELYREEDASPSTSALNELGWWRYLYQVSLNDPQTAALVLDPLSKVAYDGRIAAGLPEGVRYVHKFGSYDGNYHDGGIVWAEGRPYALVIMTYGAEVDQADAYIATAAAAIHAVMSR